MTNPGESGRNVPFGAWYLVLLVALRDDVPVGCRQQQEALTARGRP